MVKLFYAVVGDAWAHDVDIDLSATVANLKELINADNPNHCGPAELKLYLARRDGVWWRMDEDPEKSLQALKEWETNDEIKALMQDEMVWSWRLDSNAYFGKKFEWDGEINVLVKLPKSNKRLHDELDELDGSEKWFAEFRRSFVRSSDLPAINQLAEFVKGPLPAKVGLSQETFELVKHQVGEETCARVFTVDDRAPCHDLWGFYFLGALSPSDWRQGVARDFHGFWRVNLCGLISNVFDLQDNAVFRNCTVIVSTNTDPPTGTLVKLGDIGLFRTNERKNEAETYDRRVNGRTKADLGVVRASKRKNEAKSNDGEMEEPTNALRWSLDHLDGGKALYVLGYAAVSCRCMLFALSSRHANTIETTEIGAYDTQTPGGRLELLCAILQLSRLFGAIADLSPHAMHHVSKRTLVPRSAIHSVVDNTVMVMIDLGYAHGCDAGARIETRKRLIEAPSRCTCRTLYESWHGLMALSANTIGAKPMTLDELFEAIEGVLTILVELHASGWMHRDLRWPIVARNQDHGKEWFLIDFADAVSSPQAFPSGSHLLRGAHAPEMFEKGGTHTTAVDVCSVGYLIKIWNSELESTKMNAWTTSASRL